MPGVYDYQDWGTVDSGRSDSWGCSTYLHRSVGVALSVKIDATKLDSRLFHNVYQVARSLAARAQKVRIIILSRDRNQLGSFSLVERAYIDIEEVGPGVIR